MGRFVLFLGLLIGSGGAGGASFAVVVHPSNPNTNLMFAEVLAFFSGASKQWPNGSKVVLVERDSGSAAYQFLLAQIMHMSSTQYKQRLSSFKTLNSEQAACKFVFNVPGAIALIETHSLSLPECGGVTTVRIEGKLPGKEGYRLR